jgi:hypothetical protein
MMAFPLLDFGLGHMTCFEMLADVLRLGIEMNMWFCSFLFCHRKTAPRRLLLPEEGEKCELQLNRVNGRFTKLSFWGDLLHSIDRTTAD